MFSLLNKKPEKNLLQMYSLALNQAENSPDINQKLQAFGNVINFCAKDLSCLNDGSRKRDMILYWTYNNIGDIFMQQIIKDENSSAFYDAQKNYQHALNFSRNAEEKIIILNKLADLYEQTGHISDFYTVKEALIDNYPIEDRAEAFEELAETSDNDNRRIYFLEKALDYIKYQNVSAKLRCEATIRLCEKLRFLYTDKKDYANLARIEELRVNTSYLLH